MSTKPSRHGDAYVVLDVDFECGAFEVVLVNVGAGPAHDIGVKFSRKLIGADGLVITALPVFQRLRTLRPGKEIRVFVDTGDAVFRRRELNAFAATVRWRDSHGDEHTAHYQHDLDIYRNFPERM
jgi:hypothetical protein